MDFQCLWCTSNSEYAILKAALVSFPYPLTHLHYKNIKEENFDQLCSSIALCVWTEKEYPKVPKEFRDYLSSNKKQSLLIVKNSSFAYKAFEKGFKSCIHNSEVATQINNQFISLLAHYFTPQIKVPFLKDKIYVPIDPQKRILYFASFDQLIRIYKINKKVHLELVDETIETPAPFLWIWIQCQIQNLKICKIDLHHAINTNFIKTLGIDKNNEHNCLLTTGESLLLNLKEFHRLQKYVLKFE